MYGSVPRRILCFRDYRRIRYRRTPPPPPHSFVTSFPCLPTPCILYCFFQNHLSLVHTFFIGLLSPQGRAHVSGVLRQGNSLYGPGVAPLKDIVKNYAALTGSHKALLASIQLVVFRGILSSVGAMVREIRA